MRIEILRSVMLNGAPVQAGSVIDADVSDANLLIGMGKAKAAAAVEAKPEPEAVVEAPKKSRRSATITEE